MAKSTNTVKAADIRLKTEKGARNAPFRIA